MGICLNMIVKDEATRLPRLLATLEGALDACVVSDTGSSDETSQLIRDWAVGQKIPCRIVQHTWVDFAVNRNLALQEACRAREEGMHNCGWLMVIDADETLQVTDPAWKASLENGRSYSVHVRAGTYSVMRPFLFDISCTEWQWRGRVHNWVERFGAGEDFHFVSGVQVCAGGHEGAKSHPFRSAVEKAECDRKLLLEELAGSVLTASNAHRWFQLAYACLLAGRHEEAAGRMATILHHAGTHGQLRYAAAILACRSAWAAGLPMDTFRQWLSEAYTIEPQRWEAPFYQALLQEDSDPIAALSILDLIGETPPNLDGAFWMEHAIYEWRLLYQRAILLFRTGQSNEAARLASSMLAVSSLPETPAGFLKELLHRVNVK